MTRSANSTRPEPASPVVQLTVHQVVRETADAVTLVLNSPTGNTVRYRAGQFLTLRVPGQDGPLARCYSLSSSPAADNLPAVTVKRVRDGRASNWICDNVTAGMVLDTLPPAGNFVPRDWDAPFVLLAAGSGITPVMSILRTALVAHRNPITLVYANTDRESVIFDRDLAELAQRHADRLTVVHLLETEHGLPDATLIASAIADPTGAHVYICGPGPFMTVARAAASSKGIDEARIHNEVFVSLESDAFEARPVVSSADGDQVTATVELEGEEHTIAWPTSTVLLDVLLDKGLDAPYVCREGTCGGCAYTLLSGEVEMLDNQTLDDYDLARGSRLACQSLPRSEHLDIAFDI
ncbi:2Fe-2S iron-sulfur cluster-binding protein [Nocardia sp. FBN12]|uniref:2Fe-2S iron-sulfur cluster-binding protein n=1 Tax=Nocardia sp. FBN12 TaxID=3419766 RepID=UPI003D0953A7